MAQYSFYGGKQGRTYHLVEHYDSIHDMVLNFQDGGSYNDVNYNEYVIIDTFINNNEKSNRENGIIYRRGLNYSEAFNPHNIALNVNHSLDDYDTKEVTLYSNGIGRTYNTEDPEKLPPTSGPLYTSASVPRYRHYSYYFTGDKTVVVIAGSLLTEVVDGKTVNTFNKLWEEFVKHPGGGAEYVGQIAGPISGAAEVSMLDWDEFNEEYPGHVDKTKAEITAAVRPGVVETSTAAGKYYDNIQYGYFNMTDAQDNIIGVTLAFDFPYTVFNVEAHSVSAYGPTVDSTKTEAQITSLKETEVNKDAYYQASDTNKYFIWDNDKVTLDTSAYPVTYTKTPGMVETTIWNKTGTGPNYNYDGLVREKPDSEGHNFYKHYELSVPKGIHGNDADINLDSNFYVTKTVTNYKDSAGGQTTTTNLGHFKVLKSLEVTGTPGVSSYLKASYFNSEDESAHQYAEELLNYPIVSSLILSSGGPQPVENSNRLDQRKYLTYNLTDGDSNVLHPSTAFSNEVANVTVINNEVYVLYSDPEMRKNHQGASSDWQLFTFVNGTDGWIYERDDTNSTTGNQFYYKRLGSVTNGKVYYKRYNSLAELEQEYPHGFTEPDKIGQLAVVIEQDTGGTEIRTSYFYDYRNDQWTAVSEEQSSDVYHGPFNVIVSDKPDISGLMPNGGTEPQESGIWLVETEYTVTVD